MSTRSLSLALFCLVPSLMQACSSRTGVPGASGGSLQTGGAPSLTGGVTASGGTTTPIGGAEGATASGGTSRASGGITSSIAGGAGGTSGPTGATGGANGGAGGTLDAGPASTIADARDAPSSYDAVDAFLGPYSADALVKRDTAQALPDAEAAAKDAVLGRDSGAIPDGGLPGVCTGDYSACGCGCCGGQPASLRCYYPSLGESLAPIQAADVAAATGCPQAGCSAGIRYLCCIDAQSAAPGSTYSAASGMGDIDRITVVKSGGPGPCVRLSIVQPAASAPGAFRVGLPSRWRFESGAVGTCADGGALGVQAFGALGAMAMHTSGSTCLLDTHVTLFVANAAGGADTVRLDADGLAITGWPVSRCLP